MHDIVVMTSGSLETVATVHSGIVQGIVVSYGVPSNIFSIKRRRDFIEKIYNNKKVSFSAKLLISPWKKFF